MVAHIVGKEMSQEKTNIVKLDKEDDADRVIRDGCWYVSAGGAPMSPTATGSMPPSATATLAGVLFYKLRRGNERKD